MLAVTVAVIGKGGEQIASIQSETECRIQFAPGSCLPFTWFVHCEAKIALVSFDIKFSEVKVSVPSTSNKLDD